MKTKDGYRFSLNFQVNTTEQEQVGELLESLGSKKSRFIVQVLAEYMRGQAEAPPIEASRATHFNTPLPAPPPRRKPQRQALPKAIIDDESDNNPPYAAAAGPPSDHSDSGIASMLSNMALFE